MRARNQDSRPVLPSPLHRFTRTTSRPAPAQRSPMGVRDHRRAVHMAGRERETCQGQLRKPCCPQVLSGKVLCSTRSGSCLFPASCETAVFRSGSAAKRSIWGSHAFPAPSGRSGAVQPGSPENIDVARLVMQPWKFAGRWHPTCRVSAPWLITKVDARVGPRRNRRRADDEIARRGGEATRSGRGRPQDKGEGRMAPKCARPLSGARPSTSADAISHLGARAG